MQLLGLRHGLDGALHMPGNVGAALLQRALAAQQPCGWYACGKVERLLAGERLVCGDERVQRGDRQVQQAARGHGREMLLHVVAGGLRGLAERAQHGREVRGKVPAEADDALLRAVCQQAQLALGRHGVGDDRTDRRRVASFALGLQHGGDQCALHASDVRLVHAGAERGSAVPAQRPGRAHVRARTLRAGGVVRHAGTDMLKAGTHDGFVQTHAQVDQAVARAGDDRIDDVRGCAVQNQDASLRGGDGVQAVRIAGAEVQRRFLALAAEQRVDAPHEGGFAHARSALEDQQAAQLRLGHQVIEAGDKALWAHRARKQCSDIAQKHPSRQELAICHRSQDMSGRRA